MSTNYPTSLDTTTQLKNDANDATVTAATHAQAHNNVADALLAIETELGANPSGSYATVAAFLNALDTGSVKLAPTAIQTISPTGDTVALVVKVGNALNLSNLLEARLNDGTIVAFIDKDGKISAQSYEVGGSAPTGTGVVVMSNSPILTGTPTAPTPSAGDSSTKIATTAFVQSSGVPVGAVMDWPYAAASIPSWAALPAGQSVAAATYPALNTLASAAGYPHGGNGTPNFNLPDYRGRVGAGMDNMGGTAASRITVGVSGIAGTTLGATGGAEGIAITTAQMPAHDHGGGNHNHGGATGIQSNDHTHSGTANISHGHTGAGSSWGSFGLVQDDVQSAGASFTTGGISANHNHGISSSGNIISSQGSGNAHPNMSPTIIVNKIIRVQ